MDDKVNFKELPISKEDKARLPLSLRKILYNEYVDHHVPYKKLSNHMTGGQLYGQHSDRKISMIIDYSIISKIHNEHK